MPNKPTQALNVLDRELRSVAPVAMTQQTETKITIELINGFELFNTRAYHNFETWSDGYRITGYGLSVEREDLDDAVRDFVQLRRAAIEKEIQARASALNFTKDT